MARQPRILYPGAWYHVMNRGTSRLDIFYKDLHRKLFLDLLSDISEIYKVEIHAYCLMTNHYHVLIRTQLPNLPEAMRYLDSVFTMRVNRDLARDGSLMRGRYKAVLVQEDDHLLHVSRYIHLNPVDAGMVKEISDYPWSSYHHYIGSEETPDWLHKDFILGYFTGGKLQEQYKEFVDMGNDKITHDFYNADTIKPIFATESFVNELPYAEVKSPEISTIKLKKVKWSLNHIFEIVMKVCGVNAEEIHLSKQGKINIPKMLFIYLSRIVGGYKLNTIGDFLSGYHYTSLSRTLKIFRDTLIKNEDVYSLVSLCIMELRASSNENDDE